MHEDHTLVCGAGPLVGKVINGKVEQTSRTIAARVHESHLLVTLDVTDYQFRFLISWSSFVS